MKKIGRRWYIITILCTIVALVVMVAYNYQMFYSNSVENMQAIGSSNLAQVAEELDGYLTRGMEAVQSTAVSVEYMMEQGATSADIEKFLVYESERYKEEILPEFMVCSQENILTVSAGFRMQIMIRRQENGIKKRWKWAGNRRWCRLTWMHRQEPS